MPNESHPADMPLNLACLDKLVRAMIRASIGNARDFDKVAETLIVHLNNFSGTQRVSRATKFRSEGTSEGKGNYYPNGNSKRAWRKFVGIASWHPKTGPPNVTHIAEKCGDEEPFTDLAR